MKDGLAILPARNYGDCWVRFSFDGKLLDVSVHPATQKACMNFCGTRASFDGEYFLLSPGCTNEMAKQRRDDFHADYKAGRYELALGKMESYDGECGKFLNEPDCDDDRLANDKALALFSLGRFKECLEVLDNTFAADAYDDETEFSDDKFKELLAEKRGMGIFPPSEWDVYSPVARSIWENRRKCKGIAD